MKIKKPNLEIELTPFEFNRIDLKKFSLICSEKEIEPIETIHKQDRETLSSKNRKEFPVESRDSHECSTPSEKPQIELLKLRYKGKPPMTHKEFVEHANGILKENIKRKRGRPKKCTT
jgi:hypothetical protein